MFKLSNLSYQYKGENSIEFPDMEFKSGEQWLILGASGCGKTTLLHLMAGFLSSKNCNIELNGTQFSKLSSAKLDQLRGKNIGVVFQNSHFVSALNVEQNLILAQNLAGNKADKNKVKEVLERLSLGHKLKSKIKNLSVGEQQRVSIARALINNPSIILADEPTSALDDNNCNEVLKLLEDQAKEQNATLIVVTHDTRLKDKIAKRIEL